MSQRRVSSPPPQLDGFEPIELIGSGGYADVFLYQQHMPDRRVAVKVLVGDGVAGGAFTAEANLMARVSAHPYIVTILEARIAADGRPYLVMEYYPGQNHLERARSERFSIADALRVGIQVSGAVETAHRAGILHRDIKPANVLTSEYGRPGLTDFGIAAAEGPAAEAEGVSIPWSPPEAFSSTTLDVRADVYSLAATIYHLLAGRSPFEIVGGRNGALDLMARIERDRLPPTGRPDVPTSLDRLLGQAMAKDPGHRPSSVAEFARSLQAVESELRLATTPLELPDVGRSIRARIDDTDDDATRVRGVTEFEAQPLTPVVGTVPGPGTGVDAEHTSRRRPERTRQGLLTEPEVADTIHRPVAPIATSSDVDEAVERRSPLVLGAAVLLGLVVVVAGFIVFGGMGNESSGSSTTVFSIEGLDDVSLVAAVENLQGSVDVDAVVFSWEAPDAEADDEYIFDRSIDGASPVTGRTDSVSVSFDDVEPGREVCLDVIVRRSGAADSAARKACVAT